MSARRAWGAGALLAATSWAVLAADQPSPTPADSAGQIVIASFDFSPKSLSVKPGTKVTWVNRDDEIHTVTSLDKRFHSPPLDTGDTFSFTFTDAGVYNYYCRLHSYMTGTIVVE